MLFKIFGGIPKEASILSSHKLIFRRYGLTKYMQSKQLLATSGWCYPTCPKLRIIMKYVFLMTGFALHRAENPWEGRGISAFWLADMNICNCFWCAFQFNYTFHPNVWISIQVQSFFFSFGTRTNQNKTAFICSTLILLSETFSLLWCRF